MIQPADVTRRTVLTIGGAGAALALASCAVTPATTGGAKSPQPKDQGGGPSSGDLAKLSEIPVGGSVTATLDGSPIVISQPAAGTVVAFSAICTHQGCTVKPVKNEFDCPCHGSRFDSTTGAVLGGPALKPLEHVAVTLNGDSIVAG